MSDDRDLELLRMFRADEATPPDGLQARIEEQLWQAILAEESSARGGAAARAQHRWFEARWLRPAVALGAAASIAAVVAFASNGNISTSTTATSGEVRQASTSLFDSTASSLFGGSASSTDAAAPLAGQIDVRNGDSADEQLATGPVSEGAQLSASSSAYVQSLPRDPARIQAAIQDAVRTSIGDDPGGRAAFDATMQWVVSPQVPVDVRAAMLRSLGVLSGVDVAEVGADALGRASVVLGHVDATTGLRTQYLLSPRDGTVQERRVFTTNYIDPACPPGTFVEYALYDAQQGAIEAQDAPWLAWPPIVTACAPS